MKSKKNLIFIGMMGSGKTSMGLIISKKLKINFIDIDQEIEKELGMKISKIFEIKGENFFRNIEEKITLKILKKENNVISLGGGSFMSPNVQKEILSNHISFWLHWESETLIYRIKNSVKRPLAYNLSKIKLQNLIKKRSKIYSKALYKINCENLSKNEIAKKILKIYEAS